MIVDGVEVETADVLIVNVPVVSPAATVTDESTVALALLEDSETTVPPVPAGPVSVTVPVEVVPPRTELGATETLAKPAELIVKVVVTVVPLNVAEMVAVVLLTTELVVTVKVADVFPEVIETVAGTVATVRFELNVTVIPVDGAAPLRVTVPVELDPPVTEVGKRVTETSVGGLIVSVVVFEAPA